MLSWREMLQRSEGSKVVLLYAKGAVHKQGTERPKEAKMTNEDFPLSFFE